MPDQLNLELRQLRDATASLATGHLTALRQRSELSQRQLRQEVVNASTEAGIYGLTGVQDGSPVANSLALAVVRDTLAGHNVIDLPGIFAPSPGLLAGVGEPLASSHLGPLLAGNKQGAFGFTEPGDATQPTRATRTTGGDLVINGQKSYVTGGADADFINTLVEVDGIGPAMVVVDTSLPGVEIARRFESIDGSHHAAVTYSDVRVPQSHIVGEAGKGMKRAIEQVGGVRMAIAAASVGLARYSVGFVDEYLQNQNSKARPVSEHRRYLYGRLRISVYGARSTLYRTARVADSGDNAVNEIMAAKVIATETVGEVVDAAIQIVGGQALVVGHPLESIYRRVRSLRVAEGVSDVLAVNMARGRLDLGLGRL